MPPVWRIALLLCSASAIIAADDLEDIKKRETNQVVTCARPTVSDATITPETETIGEGEVYTIKCDDELIDITDADGVSSRKATCDAGKLSKLPICAACHAPSDMGLYTDVATSGTLFFGGDSVTVSCEHNLVNFGSERITCATGDKFLFDFLPECLSKVPIKETKTSFGVSVPAVNDDSNLENIQWVTSNEQEVWIELFFDSITAVSIVKVFNKDGCMASDSYDLKVSAKKDDQYILDCTEVDRRSRTKRYDCALQFQCGWWTEATSVKITDVSPTYDGENVVMKITEVIIGRAAIMSVGITTAPAIFKEEDNNDVSIICTVKYDPVYFFEGFTLRVQHYFKNVAGVQPKQISSKDLKDGCSYSEEELVYTISVANKVHNGPYRCKASKWKSITLTLAFVIELVPVISSIKTYRWREVNFTCRIDGDEPHAIKWFKDQSEISALAPYEMYVTAADFIPSSLDLVWNGTLVLGYSILKINPEGTKTAEEVQYRCEVQWDLNGSDVSFSTNFNLLVHDVYVGLEEREVMTGTTTTLSCVVDAPPETTTPFDITWTGGDVIWDSKNPTTIPDYYSISAGELVDQEVDDTSAAPRRRRQVSTLEVRSAAVVRDLQYTCTVNSTTFNLENADDKYYLNLGVYDVTPVSKNVYRGDFSSETISCVVTNMASTEHTILWQPDDTMSGDDISWISPSVTSELTLKKELVTDDHVYTCKVQADTKSEPAFIEVHLNFYSIEISQSVEIRTLSEAVILTCKVTEISHDMLIAWFFAPNYMGDLRFHQEFVVESNLKISELTVVRKATEQDRVYICRVSSTQQTFTTSTAWDFTVDLNVYDVVVVSKDVHKDSIGEETMITCEVSGISVDPEIIWSNTDKNGAVQDSDAGTFVNNRKTSVLSVTLNSAEDTQFLCNIESDETKKLTGTQETASIFVYDVEPKSKEVKKNTEAKISCTIADISTAMQITWSELTSGDTTHISVSDTFYPETENQISIITMTSEVVISDKVFTCTVSSLQNPTSDQTNFKVELKVYDVTVSGREVSKGKTTTLTCVVSNLSQKTEIQWHDESDQIQGSSQHYTVYVDEDITDDGSQRSTLTIHNPTESKVFTCRVSSTLYPNSPTSYTPVHLYVYEVAGPSIEVKRGVTVTLILTISNTRDIGVTVTWRDSSGNVLEGGTEYSEGVQVSTLSIQNVQSESVYTCAVNSKEFVESESSDHVITLKTYDVIPSPGHLVKIGTEVTLSCEISDLDEALSVEWLKDTTVITNGGDYTLSLSSLESGKQTATLLIGGVAVKQAAYYTCRVESIQYDSSPHSDTDIGLEVYEVEMTSQAALVDDVATITCTVTGLGTNSADISWLPEDGGSVTTEDLDTDTGSRTSALTIAAVTEKTYSINFICVVKSDSGKYPNSPASSTEKHVNPFSVDVGHREVKKNTETELSCAITEIGAAMKITWTGYTDNSKLLPAEGSEGFDTRTQSQTSTLTVGSEAVISDATYTCTVSSVSTGNLFETKNFDVQLFVYDVNVHDREVATGTTTTLTCIASEISQEMEIKWILKDLQLVSNSEYKISEVNSIELYASQTSKLTILNPTKSEIFTCQVSSTLYPESPNFATVVNLYVYDISATGVEVKQGDPASLTCTVTYFRTSGVTVEWQNKQVTVIGPSDYNEVSVLSLKDVQSDLMYTCVVKSKEFPESEVTEEIVNLKTYVVTPKHRQVKIGTEIKLSCEISDLDEAVSVKWLKDTTVITNGGDYTLSLSSLESGKQTATLMINRDAVTKDTLFTFKVQSIQYDNSPESVTEVKLWVYEVENLQKAVLVGDPAYLTCKVVRLSYSNDVEISWLPSNSGTSTPGNLDTKTGVKISTLTITNPQTDNTYTCLVKSELFPDSPPSETEQHLDTFSIQVTNKEVKRDTETSMWCTITDIKTDMRITWSGYQVNDVNYSTKIDDSVSGSRSSVLTLKSGAVSTDSKLTCTVQLVSEIKTFDVQLLVYSVDVQNGVEASGSTSTLTCIVSDLTQAVTIEWRLGNTKLETDEYYSIDVVNSIHTDRSQISHLTILKTTQSEVFTCQVASTLYLESPVSETLAYLDVYDVEVQDREVATGRTTTLTCIVSSLIKRKKSVSVAWFLGSEELDSNIVNSVYTDGSQITSKLTIPNPTESETFTCKVSLDSPISSTLVHLYVYGITGTGVEVKQGDTASLTCAVSDIRQTGVTVQWINSSGSVTETVDSSTGANISVLSLEDVQSDSLYTCVAKSKEFPNSESTEKIVILKTYVVKPKNQEVKPGSDVTLSCEITDLDSPVNVQWLNEAGDNIEDGEQYTVTHSTGDNQDHVTTIALEGSTVTEDLSFTCRVESVEFSNSPSSNTVVKLVVNGVCMREESQKLGQFGKGPWVFIETRGRQEFSIACTDGYVRRVCLRTGEWDVIDSSSCTLLVDKINREIDSLGEEATFEQVESVVNNLSGMDEYVKNTPHEAGQVINSLSKLNSKFRLVKTPNAVDLKKAALGSVSSVQNVNKQSNILKDEDKQKIIPMIEALAQSVDSIEGTLVSKQITVKSVSKSNEPITLEKPSEMKGSAVMFDFGRNLATRATVAVMAEDFVGILPQPLTDGTMESPVISVNFMKEDGEGSAEFTLHFPKEANKSSFVKGIEKNYTCVYLDTVTSEWKGDGCVISYKPDGGHGCSCNHTTSFAVLLSLTDVTDPYQDIVSYIMLGVNMTFLLITFLLVAPFRELRRKQLAICQVNLILSLLLANAGFTALSSLAVVTVDPRGIPMLSLNTGCVTGAIIVQYLFLCSFSWMACTAYTLHSKIVDAVKSFGRSDPYYMLKCALMSWVAPGLLPLTAFTVSYATNYRRDQYESSYVGKPGAETGSVCWVENPWRLYTFMLPCYLILLVDVACFVMIARVVVKSAKAGSNPSNLEKAAKAMFAVGASVGLPWVFAALTIIKPLANVFQYIFIILAGLQGPLLFVSLVILQDDIKIHTLKLFGFKPPKKGDRPTTSTAGPQTATTTIRPSVGPTSCQTGISKEIPESKFMAPQESAELMTTPPNSEHVTSKSNPELVMKEVENEPRIIMLPGPCSEETYSNHYEIEKYDLAIQPNSSTSKLSHDDKEENVMIPIVKIPIRSKGKETKMHGYDDTSRKMSYTC